MIAQEPCCYVIGWRTTNAWLAGNLACKCFLVLRAFGLYLSSNVLVCISLDRFFAVLYPLRLPIARKRSKMMLYFAWFVALLCSLPQSLVFRVMRHPKIPDFQQCVSFDAFSSQNQELAYNVFCLCAMYFLPLMIITVCYACIFYEISKNSKEISGQGPPLFRATRLYLGPPTANFGERHQSRLAIFSEVGHDDGVHLVAPSL
ncbi:7 transmembrane receptor (rhodopsin family) domain-containing protein [Phthorimaea operculella]|nr:7 transmembrane receptor (rhodopsin family) domain-containing protein [Phthorimaea operculella]